jgi:hypothetical protein
LVSPVCSRQEKIDFDKHCLLLCIVVKYISIMSIPAVSELAWRTNEVGLHPRDLTPTFIDAANIELAQMGYRDIVTERELALSGLADFHPDESLQPQTSITFNQPPSGYIQTYPDVAETRVAMIGAGAAGIACAAYMSMRGFDASNLSMIDPRGDRGSLWETKLREGGFNNKKPLYFPPGITLPVSDRSGDNMRDFLRAIADTHLNDASYVPDSATSVFRSPYSDAWVVQTEHGAKVEADYIVISNGVQRPRRIDGRRIKSNLDVIAGQVTPHDLAVERSQRSMDYRELADGRTDVLIGIGNSTQTMIKQKQVFRDLTGIDSPYLILTDLPREAIENPYFPNGNRPPIFRDSGAGRLVGYSGDLPEDAKAYFRALGEGRIISGVNGVYFDTKTGMLKITSSEGRIQPIETPRVFALLGYERDNQLFEDIGARVLRGLLRKPDGPHIRVADGAVMTGGEQYLSNVFALGAVAATPQNPNAAVIPGIFAMLPKLILTAATREFARHRQAPERLGQKLGRLLFG